MQQLASEIPHDLVRRVVARVRASGHGGMLALVPQAGVGRVLGPTATLRRKYAVRQTTSSPYLSLLQVIVERLTELGDLS